MLNRKPWERVFALGAELRGKHGRKALTYTAAPLECDASSLLLQTDSVRPVCEDTDEYEHLKEHSGRYVQVNEAGVPTHSNFQR